MAVGIEEKQGKVGIGPAIGSSLAASLHNFEVHEKLQPVAILRLRHHYLSFMKANFHMGFIDAIICGTESQSAVVEVYPKCHASGTHAGYNLLESNGRKAVFEALYRLREFLLHLPN